MVRWPFSRFARRPEQPSWDVVVRRSSIGLAALRARWYSECVETLDRNSIPIANRGLTGRGEQAAIAFQLMVISYFLPDTPYVPREQGPDFAHRLYLEVAGALLVDVMRYVERYDEVSGGQQLIRFSWDIARHATGKDAVGLAGPFSRRTQLLLLGSVGRWLRLPSAMNEALRSFIPRCSTSCRD